MRTSCSLHVGRVTSAPGARTGCRGGRVPRVTVRYWAAAKAAAGRAEDLVEAATVGDALEQVGRTHGERLRQVPRAASLLVDGERVSREAAPTSALADGAVVEVLPPF